MIYQAIRLTLVAAFLMPAVIHAGNDGNASDWKATTHDLRWTIIGRDAQLKALAPEIRAGMSHEQLIAVMGEPQSVWKTSKGAVLTYGVNRMTFFHVREDGAGQVVGISTNAFRGGRELESVLGQTGAVTSASLDIDESVGAWRATSFMDLKSSADRLELGLNAARFLTLDMPMESVEGAFGKPASVSKRPDRTFWCYRLGPSDFLVISYSEKNVVLGAQLRQYIEDSGRLVFRPLLGFVERTEDPDLDIMCWRASLLQFTITDNRKGIGKRMALHIKKGITREAVIEKLGEPVRRVKGGSVDVFSYETYTDSSLGVYFDEKGLVANVKHRP